MTGRTFPSYYMYKDNRGEWRWSYAASNGQIIAVSSEGYKRRADCERGIEIMKSSYSAPTYLPSSLLYAA